MIDLYEYLERQLVRDAAADPTMDDEQLVDRILSEHREAIARVTARTLRRLRAAGVDEAPAARLGPAWREGAT